MSRNYRSRISKNRFRLNNWRNLKLKNVIIYSSISVFVIALSIVIVNAVNFDDKKIVLNDNEQEQIDSLKQVEDDEEIIENNIEKTSIKINLLGEVMMGGKVTSKLDYMYNNSFKNIYTILNDSDFNYMTLSTVVTNVKDISNIDNKYVVTKDIANIFNSLEIDAVNVASDHMNDYSKTFFDNTIDVLNDKKINITGLLNSPMYSMVNEKKICIISANDVYLNNSKIYEDYGINIYNEERMKKEIEKAKDSSDFIIVNMHWGRENIFGVTNTMRKSAEYLIDLGADLIVGEHAFGNYPIVEYKGVPIIYSLGSLITDDLSTLNKKKYMYSAVIDEDNKIDRIEMTPIYMDTNYILHMFKDYDELKCESFNIQYNDWQIQNGLESEIKNNKIIIKF